MSKGVTVVVRWNKNKYSVEVDLDQPPVVFKAQIFALTGVPPDRQKIMGLGGGVLKSDDSWEGHTVKPNQSVMLMGSADAVLTAPPPPTAESPAAAAVQDSSAVPENLGYHVGLKNLGNTCYLNATVQCLRSCRELEDGILVGGGGGGDAAAAAVAEPPLVGSLKKVFSDLKKGERTVVPMTLVAELRKSFPQFAEKDSAGAFYKQQDAEESWTSLMTSLATNRPTASLVKSLFEVRLTQTLTCSEDPSVVESRDATVQKLVCHIDNQTAFLIEGLKRGLVSEVTKTCQALGRESVFAEKSSITGKLPRYLTVQMMRFYWKESIKKKSKIVKPVQFPFVLDVQDLCDDKLKADIASMRNADREIEDANAGLTTSTTTTTSTSAPMAVEGENAGLYELCGVLTHMGMYADGGHYVGWVREDGTEERWLKFDDDKVSICPGGREDIKKLDGHAGGDWHIAYMLQYRAKKRPTLSNPK